MSDLDQAETTRLLRDWAEGDRAALDILAPRVYKELRRVAGSLMQAEQGGRTLTATALVHEAYLRLVDVSRVEVLEDCAGVADGADRRLSVPPAQKFFPRHASFDLRTAQ